MVDERGLVEAGKGDQRNRSGADGGGRHAAVQDADLLVTATYRVSFQVFPAERFVLLGPSGCGKSSLLKAVGAS